MASKTYLHDPSGTTTLPLLRPLLPATLPLVRRIQFNHRSPHSHILASFPPSTTTLPQCYTVAFCDRSRAPETEMWVFCSIELFSSSATPPYSPQFAIEQQQSNECTTQLISLFQELRTLGAPPTTDPDIDASEVLIGSLHERTFRLLQNHEPGDYIKINHGPYKKYIFNTQTNPPSTKPLPPDFTFAPLRPEHFALVLSRTSIPRRERTLLLCPSMGIFPSPSTSTTSNTPTEPPVAWAFLSPDGSLASLHCEEPYQGQGLAKAVTSKLFEIGITSFASDGLTHADVDTENLASQGVCRALGARKGWEVYWTRIDLEKVV
ncbi:MAG: hypothetical protein M1812_002922 [Candelaria pacifica]|nr:MAG: hypothetical protein M1812_002922 [Candelaria pacifica]